MGFGLSTAFFLILLIIGMVAGVVFQLFRRQKGLGMGASILVGTVGALCAGFIVSGPRALVDMGMSRFLFEILIPGFIGAAFVLYVVSLIKSR